MSLEEAGGLTRRSEPVYASRDHGAVGDYMSANSKTNRILARVEPGRRDAMRKILLTATYTAPVVVSFSLNNLAQSQPFCGNQPQACAVPATSNWSLASLAGLLAAAGAYLLRRRRKH